MNDSALVSRFLEKFQQRKGYTKYWLKMHDDDKKEVEQLIDETQRPCLDFLKAADVMFSKNQIFYPSDF